MTVAELRLFNFLAGTDKDCYGETFSELLDYSNRELERCHDQVQWLFPLHEASRMSFNAPLVTKSVATQAANSVKVAANLKAGVERYRDFFGIGDFHDPFIATRWCQEGDHNLLRVTRIIRSLRLLGQGGLAQDFFQDAMDVAGHLSATTRGFWKKAATADPWSSLQPK